MFFTEAKYILEKNGYSLNEAKEQLLDVFNKFKLDKADFGTYKFTKIKGYLKNIDVAMTKIISEENNKLENAFIFGIIENENQRYTIAQLAHLTGINKDKLQDAFNDYYNKETFEEKTKEAFKSAVSKIKKQGFNIIPAERHNEFFVIDKDELVKFNLRVKPFKTDISYVTNLNSGDYADELRYGTVNGVKVPDEISNSKIKIDYLSTVIDFIKSNIKDFKIAIEKSNKANDKFRQDMDNYHARGGRNWSGD